MGIAGNIKKILSVLPAVKAGKTLMAAVIFTGFLTGYNGTWSYINSCGAQGGPLPVVPAPPVIGGNCICCTPTACPWPCDTSGTADNIEQQVTDQFEQDVEDASEAVEGDGYNGAGSGIAYAVDTMVMAVLNRFQQMELDLIAWWQSMYEYNLNTAMRDETRQMNTATMDQSNFVASTIDAVEQSQNVNALQEVEVKSRENLAPSEETCVASTNSGGLGRASEFSKGMRKAMERAARGRGLNVANTPAAHGAAVSESVRYEEYENLFCDPNGGLNPCAGNPAYYNADTQVTRRFYNALTINVDDNPDEAAMVAALMDNMTGSGSADTLKKDVLRSAVGKELFVKRRAYLARHAAARAVPNLMLGWRTPGSNMGPWIRQLRSEAGVPPTAMSDNPSYREIMHAMTIDRFNSGKYAIKMVGSQGDMEKEKLMLSAFYLMQLRDYFELLERQALALAVQVSILADQEAQKVPKISALRPVR